MLTKYIEQSVVVEPSEMIPGSRHAVPSLLQVRPAVSLMVVLPHVIKVVGIVPAAQNYLQASSLVARFPTSGQDWCRIVGDQHLLGRGQRGRRDSVLMGP